jgi:hypothetical protein
MVKPTIDEFKAWLAERSNGVETRFMRWLIDDEGHCSDEDYCPECAEIRLAVESYRMAEFTEIDGWDEYFESDGMKCCGTCAVLLNVSMSAYGFVRDYVKPFEDGTIDDPSDRDCYMIHEFLTGTGAFHEDEHWPRLQALAAKWVSAPSDTTHTEEAGSEA